MNFRRNYLLRKKMNTGHWTIFECLILKLPEKNEEEKNWYAEGSGHKGSV